jgi:UDP-N-acetylglucosamine--N-acetylmuramyl-(pentapeptide) pyrophosphoryl-undecaprenol N-acetylglucosamine transferase
MPLPGTWGDEQRKNAALLANAGGAIVLEQSAATPERLRQVVLDVTGSPERLASMRDGAGTIGDPNAAANLLDELLALAGR